MTSFMTNDTHNIINRKKKLYIFLFLHQIKQKKLIIYLMKNYLLVYKNKED